MRRGLLPKVLPLVGLLAVIGMALSAEVTDRAGPAPGASAVYPKDPAEMEKLAKQDPLALLLLSCRWSDERITDYTCRFQKVERIDGELRKPEIMRMKFRCKPLSVYLKWTGELSKDQEVIYVEGANKGNAWVHPSGLLGWLFRKVNVDPNSKLAMKHSRRPISMAGMGFMGNLVIGQCVDAKARGDLTLTYEGIRHEGGRPSYVFKRVLPKDKGYPVEVLIIYIDREYLVCVRTDGYDWGGDLISHYLYSELVINPGVTDADFDPDNREYAYRLF